MNNKRNKRAAAIGNLESLDERLAPSHFGMAAHHVAAHFSRPAHVAQFNARAQISSAASHRFLASQSFARPFSFAPFNAPISLTGPNYQFEPPRNFAPFNGPISLTGPNYQFGHAPASPPHNFAPFNGPISLTGPNYQ